MLIKSISHAFWRQNLILNRSLHSRSVRFFPLSDFHTNRTMCSVPPSNPKKPPQIARKGMTVLKHFAICCIWPNVTISNTHTRCAKLPDYDKAWERKVMPTSPFLYYIPKLNSRPKNSEQSEPDTHRGLGKVKHWWWWLNAFKQRQVFAWNLCVYMYV